MAEKIAPDALSVELGKSLGQYGRLVVQYVNLATQNAAKDLVNLTKATAPKRRGQYRRKIKAHRLETRADGSETWEWYVDGKEYRLTHLLVHGHQTRNGGRTKADPFLSNAVAKVYADYEAKVHDIIEKDSRGAL